MTDMYAPNQQTVREDGSGPAEEGTGGDEGDPTHLPGAELSEAPTDDLDNMTKDQLLDEADRLGIPVSTAMNKDEIKAAIRES
jgi:hypothetical protein